MMSIPNSIVGIARMGAQNERTSPSGFRHRKELGGKSSSEMLRAVTRVLNAFMATPISTLMSPWRGTTIPGMSPFVGRIGW